MEKQYFVTFKPLFDNGDFPEKWFYHYWPYDTWDVSIAKSGTVKIELNNKSIIPIFFSQQMPESQLILLKLTYGIP